MVGFCCNGHESHCSKYWSYPSPTWTALGTSTRKLDFRLDVDITGEGGFRVAQLTPSGSPTSIVISNGLTDAAPGSLRGLCLVVDDIVATRADIAARGIEISEVFHEANGGGPSVNTEGRVPGLAPGRARYFSFATFNDLEGNEWFFVLCAFRRYRPNLPSSTGSSGCQGG